MKAKRSYITIYRLPWDVITWEQREEWFQARTEGISYGSALIGEEAAEEAFHITNAPDDCLEDSQKQILKEQDFRGPSLSVGDVVKVGPIIRESLPEYYMCKSFGWEKFGGNVIELLKHLD